MRSPCRSFCKLQIVKGLAIHQLGTADSKGIVGCLDCASAEMQKRPAARESPKGNGAASRFPVSPAVIIANKKRKSRAYSRCFSLTSRALRFAPRVPKTLWKRKPHESADSRRNAETVARLRFSRMEQRWFRKELPVASRPRRSAAVIHVLRQRCKTVILFKPPHRRSVPSRTLTDAGPKTESRNIEWQCARLNGQNTAANGWSVDSPRCFKLKTQRIKIKSSLFCTAGSFP